MREIHLWGVKQNNLKDLEVRIPIGSFTVVCGPSGSGKSSLAFQTLYAEGQRRYIESLSNYTRQFIGKMPKPDVEGVENIPPAIALEQKNSVRSSRATVGTTTEVADYLRLLFEKIGIAYCPDHKIALVRDSPSSGATRVIKDFAGRRGYVLSWVGEKRNLSGKKLLEYLRKEGYQRVYFSSDEIRELNDPTFDRKGLPKKPFFLVIDRLAFEPTEQGRLMDSLAQAYRASLQLNSHWIRAQAQVRTTDGEQMILSESFSCSVCDRHFPDISASLFSPNSPVGACPTCKGFGNLLVVDEAKVIPDPRLSLAGGAIKPFTMPSAASDRKALRAFCKEEGIDMHTPWEKLPAKHRQMIWEGTKKFFGVMGLFEYLETKKYKMHVRVFLARHKSPQVCPTCHGSRLKPEAQQVLIGGRSITDFIRLTIDELLHQLRQLRVSPEQAQIIQEPLRQLLSRLEFLQEVGVGYLTLDRPTRTLSGGEYQRLSLSNQLGVGLSHTLYVLDEPTIGLHPRDNARLIKALHNLRALGNTLVVVEHDQDVIENSSHVIEMGPGSGHLGGQVVYAGPRAGFYECAESSTVPYLEPRRSQLSGLAERPVDRARYRYKLELLGCTGNNLKNVDIVLPLHRLITVTGVSGSGKSSLVSQTLYPALARQLGIEYLPALPFRELRGAENLKNVLFVDQSPIGKTARSNPVTYMKIFDSIRNLFADTYEARGQGYEPRTFSLNVEGGRCPVCKGVGFEVVDMMFMDDVEIPCEACGGQRYRAEILQIPYRGRNIAEVLNMTVGEAMDFFVASPAIRRPLALLREVGLEYVRLGQSARTLSGGESQRLKVARELSGTDQTGTLYIFDEPTTGLHFREIDLLLKVLHRLVDAGGTVLLIEHNLEVIRRSDHIIDIGPEAGAAGGTLVFAGSPAELSQHPTSHTGQFLNARGRG